MDEFRCIVWDYYASNGRHDLPWRQLPADTTQRFYRVLVSEIMLQQTGVSRVIEKFAQWMQKYPKLHDAADASFADILKLWHGLGYNRRALYLHEALMKIRDDGIPDTIDAMTALKGVGTNTAGALMAYVHNKPAVFIETNIRTVYIHHFFANKGRVDDKELLPVIHDSLIGQEPREWYWALMDYGTHLKKHSTAHRSSAQYKKQSPFEGSLRQLRARILRELSASPQDLQKLTAYFSDDRLTFALEQLERENLIQYTRGLYAIAGEVVK